MVETDPGGIRNTAETGDFISELNPLIKIIFIFDNDEWWADVIRGI